jgi:hypothetical protein
MTTLRQIMTDAAVIVAAASEGQPAAVAYDADRAVKIFNRMMREFRGQEIGQKLKRQWDAAASDIAIAGGLYAVNVSTIERPNNGDRLGVIGARTVTASTGATIEGAASVTTADNTTWFFRDDLGDWVKEEDLTLDDDHLLSTDADEALVECLAARWFFERESRLTPELTTLAQKGRSRLFQLYGSRRVVAADGPLLRGLAQRQYWPTGTDL